MDANFKSVYCSGNIISLGNFDIQVKGRIDDDVKNNVIHYIAAAPADHRSTYTGSGLPFANQIQAFDNTPNVGSVDLDKDNKFVINLMTPNSYMVGLGSVTVPPTLYVSYTDLKDEERTISIQVSKGIPYRSMTYPIKPFPRSGPEFYESQFYIPVRSQEQILMEAGYPRVNMMPINHWGTKPPM